MSTRRAGLAMLTVCACAALAIGQTGFTNFETAPVHPVDMTPDGTRLLVTNSADARVEVFTLGGAMPVWSGSIPVGMDPVSVRVRSNTEAWVVNRISDTVSVVDLGTMNVVATIATGDEPGDVVFAGSPQRAWVSVSGLNQVRVYDPANIAAAPTIISIAGHRPTALLTDGTRVMAAIFFAGNRSTALSADVVSQADGPAGGVNPPSNTATSAFNPPLASGLPSPPAVGMIVNRETTPNGDRWKDDAGRFWDAKIGWLLSANAVAVINASTKAVAYAKNIGNIQMGLGLNPANGKVYVTQVYLRNELRFESVARSQFPRTRVALFDPVTLSGGGIVDLNPHLMVTPPIATYKSSITAAERALSIADPRGIVWKPDGSAAYVSGMGSNNVAKLTFPGSAPTRLATIPVGQGPTGMAYDASRNRLYVYNRFDANVSVISTSSDVEIGRVGFFDPTSAAIKAGRPVHYSATSSFYGIASCNSCHIDTKTDMQAWDLGDPSASMKTFNQTCDVLGACNDWHPMKGPMMTQTLQGIVGNGPMHRRGDREDVAAFTVGFTGLLGMAAPPNAGQMQQLTDFYATLAFPPQPNRTMSDGLPGSVPGFAGSPSAGAALFNGPALNGAAKSCVQCHSLASGGGIEIVSGATIGQSQGLKAPHLRDLYRQSGFDKSSQSSNRGYGFGHDGSSGTLFEFLQGHTVTFPATSAGDQMRRDLEAYLMCFSTGMHPAVGMQQTVTLGNKNDPAVLAAIASMQAIADSGAVGLVAHGNAAGLARGYVYVAGAGAMQSDRLSETPMLAALVAGVLVGNEITLTVVPSGTQSRAGVDRDADGFLDRDEIDAGSNPADAISTPPSSCRPTIGQSPQPVTVFAGHTVHFTVSASAAVSYQWRKGGAGLMDSATVSGAHTPALALSAVVVGDSGAYDCVVTNGCGATVSGAAALTVNPCAADFNGGGLAVQDIFDFLNAWFAGLPSADFNGGGLAVQDIFDFLNAWFAGC